jgi:hypothetical protein
MIEIFANEIESMIVTPVFVGVLDEVGDFDVISGF